MAYQIVGKAVVGIGRAAVRAGNKKATRRRVGGGRGKVSPEMRRTAAALRPRPKTEEGGAHAEVEEALGFAPAGGRGSKAKSLGIPGYALLWFLYLVQLPFIFIAYAGLAMSFVGELLGGVASLVVAGVEKVASLFYGYTNAFGELADMVSSIAGAPGYVVYSVGWSPVLLIVLFVFGFYGFLFAKRGGSDLLTPKNIIVTAAALVLSLVVLTAIFPVFIIWAVYMNRQIVKLR